MLLKVLTSLSEGDHIFGLLPLLASRLNGAGGTAEGVEDPRSQGNQDQQVSFSCLFHNIADTLGNSLSRYMGP
jgi:hypothetical protein